MTAFVQGRVMVAGILWIACTGVVAAADAPAAANSLAVSPAAAPVNFSGNGLITAPAPPVNTNGTSLINGAGLLEGEDRLNVTIGDQETYDDNLFRIPSSFPVGTTVSPNASRGDDINEGYAALDGQWTVSRQSFNVNVRGGEHRFAHNSALNNTSLNGEMVWDWRIGSLLSGQAGAIYTHSLAAFSTTRYFGRDLVNAKEYFGALHLDLGPHWTVLGDARQVDTEHSAIDARVNNFSSKSASAGIQYAFSADDTVGLEYRYTNGHYPTSRTLNGLPFDFDYRDNKALLLLKYAPSAKTLLDLSAGYVKRNYPFEPIGAFSGDIWRISGQWTPTEKTQLVLSAWRELGAYLDAQSDYFVSKGESITPSWLPSEKVTLNLTVSHETQGYVAYSPSVNVLGGRHDSITYEQIAASYTPWRALTLGISIRGEQRKSTYSFFTYDDKSGHVNISYKF